MLQPQESVLGNGYTSNAIGRSPEIIPVFSRLLATNWWILLPPEVIDFEYPDDDALHF